jgi:AcrR family transcriptional regulator
MVLRRTDGEAGSEGLPDGRPGSVVRRAPFSDSPRVGARGQRTQQAILDAALRVFGEAGYHRCRIDQITKRAGCSRASFYQYFSSKEDVFRHLAGQVARQLDASTEALGPLTPDRDGWLAVHGWVERHGEIYGRYEPVFHAFEAASESDEAVAAGAARWGSRHVAKIGSRLTTTFLPPRLLDPMLLLLMECLTRTYDMAGILRSAVPDAYPAELVEGTLTDVIHRALFGRHAKVNVHAAGSPPPAVSFGPAMRRVLAEAEAVPDLTAAGRQTFEGLTGAGRDVFVRRGFHRTRVDDVVEVAGVSHGAFYRYFENKDHLARILAARAMLAVSTVINDVPVEAHDDDPAGRAALRRWLRRYNATQASEAAMLRVWVDAALEDEALSADSAPALDWGRRQMARFLRPRGFGDAEVEGLVLVALLSRFGAREQSPATVDAAAHLVELGFLGRPPAPARARRRTVATGDVL